MVPRTGTAGKGLDADPDADTPVVPALLPEDILLTDNGLPPAAHIIPNNFQFRLQPR